MEHWDRLWPGGYTFAYADGLFRPSTDTFLLGAFPRLRRGMTVCDLGAGTGLLGLLLLAREPELTVTGVELQPAACGLFRRTAAENGLEDRLRCLEGDLRDPGLLPPGRFRLADVMEELRRVRLEPKRLRFVHHTAAASPSLFLLEARLGGRPGLTAEPPLLLRGPDGGETEDVRRAYFRDKE